MKLYLFFSLADRALFLNLAKKYPFNIPISRVWWLSINFRCANFHAISGWVFRDVFEHRHHFQVSCGPTAACVGHWKCSTRILADEWSCPVFGGFHKLRYPKMDGFLMENPMKTDDLGVPPLMETRIDWVDDYEMEWDLYELICWGIMIGHSREIYQPTDLSSLIHTLMLLSSPFYDSLNPLHRLAVILDLPMVWLKFSHWWPN